jgi:Cu(I)/Ag(I) efflux system membrane fusion protein
MNPRNFTLMAVVALAAAGGGYWLGKPAASPHHQTTATQGERVVDYYQSPMHPWIVSDEPGRCTICGMELVAVYVGESGAAMGETVQLSESSASVIGVATAPVQKRELQRRLRVNGIFEIDHTRHRVLSARVPGRIEELFVDQVGIHVDADEPLVTLYSPSMLTAQRIYVERRVAGPGAFSASQVAEARERLLDLGATAADLDRLDETRQPDATVTLRAPFAGTVTSRGDRAYIGQYVEESDTLFEIGDLASLWFVFNAYETDLTHLAIGQSVTIASPGSHHAATVAPIAFIDPNLNPMTQTARARVVIPNADHQWRHMQTASAEVQLSLGEHLTVPRSAVLFTRDEPLVFVEVASQTYQPRSLTLGVAGDHAYAVVDGLQAGERVVSRAALMIEGQAQLMAPPKSMDSDSHGMAMSHDITTDIAKLSPFVIATAHAAEALAADDLNAYIESLPALHEAWGDYVEQTPDAPGGPLDELVNQLTDGPTIKDARDAFEPFSTAVADLTKQAGLHESGAVHIFQCPMSPVLGKGRWVQIGDQLRNPFFGSGMLSCGSPIK